MGKARLLDLIVVITLTSLTSPLQAMAAMLITLHNDLAQPLAITCHSNDATPLPGLKLLNPSDVYGFQVPGKFTSGKRYWCTFEAAGKPTTSFDVFLGWGGVKNMPCGCLGGTCAWLVTDGGFSCNSGKFSRGWGN